MSFPVYCHHCPRPHWIGDASQPIVFAGIVSVAVDRVNVPEPRSAYRCDKCGWVTIVRPATRESAPWRQVELKQG